MTGEERASPTTPKTARETLNRQVTEDGLLETVTGHLTLFKWRWVHIRRSDKAVTMGHPGLPDIIAVRGSRLIFAELKTEKGKLRPGQEAWMADLIRLNDPRDFNRPRPEVYTIRPSNVDAFLGTLR